MIRRSTLAVALAALLCPALAAAGGFEIVPFYSYAVGGEIEGDAAGDVDFAGDGDLGLLVGFPVAPGARIEVFYARYDSAIEREDGSGQALADLDIEYLHVGGLWEWGPGPGQTFATASAGVAELDPAGAALSSETLPSFGLGGGGKYYFHDHVGVRLEGRILANHIDGSRRVFCAAGGCLGRVTGSFLWQFQAAAGLIFRFD